MKTKNKFILNDVEISLVNEPSVNSVSLPNHIRENLSLLKTVHTHTGFELFFIGDNPLQVTTTKQTYVYKNQIVIIPPTIVHYTIGSENAFSFLCNLTESKTPSPFSFITQTEKENKIVAMPYSEQTKSIVSLIKSTNSNNHLKLSHLYPLLFLSLAENSILQEQVEDNLENDYAVKINSILTYEFMLNIQLKDVANKLHLSEKQASRVVKKYFNKSFSELLLSRRLTIASLYLAQTKIKISEIFELTGFQTENYFFSAFKKEYGITPRAYRLKFQKV